MFTIIISEKGGDQRRVEFDKAEITIGRVQGNDVILPKGNVSKRHSRIVLKDGKYIIVDLKSTNGTYVNGRKITSPLVLKGSDKIYIGDFILTLEEAAEDGAVEGGMAEDSGPPAVAAMPFEAPSPPPPPPPMPGVVPPSSLVANPPPPPKRPSAPPPPPPKDEEISVDEEDIEEAPKPLPRAAAAAALAARAAAAAARDVPRPSGPIPAVDLPRPTIQMPAPAPPHPIPEMDTGPSTGPIRDKPPSPEPRVAEVPITRPPRPRVAAPGDLVHELNARLWGQLDLSRVPPDKLGEEALWQRAERAALDLVEQLEADGRVPAAIDQNALIKDALQELLGLGPLDELLADEEVVDIVVNRPDQVLADRGSGLTDVGRAFSSEAALRLAVERLLITIGRRLDAPLVDVRLRDGARLTAALPPLALRGPCLTLRKTSRQRLSLADLVKGGVLSPNMAEFLATCVNVRRNILVCGGASAGKSVLLGALAGALPSSERVISVEEVAELSLAHAHWVALEARPPEAPILDVLRGALRMRPDRLIVGEVRGPEAYELLLSAASAHDGTMFAIAAEGAGAALARLESLARLAAWDTSPRGLRELCAQAVHVVVHVARWADGSRRVVSISEVSGVDNDGPVVRELFRYQAPAGRFAGAGVVPRFYEQLMARGHKADPALFR